MPRTQNRLRRTAALASLVATACAAVVALTPTAATATSYNCNNGVLYEDGSSLGAHDKSNPYDLGGGITMYCMGSRTVTIYHVSD